MNSLAKQWPVLVVVGLIVVSAALGLLGECCNPRGEEDRATKRERDWYESAFMRRATVRSLAPAREAMLSRVNVVISCAGIP